MKLTKFAIITILVTLLSVSLIGCGGGGSSHHNTYAYNGGYYDDDFYQPVPDYFEPQANNHVSDTSTTINADSSSALPGKIYALFIGVGNYSNFPKLSYSVSDANSMATALGNSGINNLWYQAETYILTDTNATKANIINTLDNIASKMGPNDMFVMFYSGHGTNSEGSNTPSPSAEAYIVPVDGANDYSTMLSSGELRTELLKMPESSFKTIIFDSCFSGGFIGKDSNKTPKFVLIPKNGNIKGNGGFKAIGQDLPNVNFLSSSSYNQISFEIPTYSHGEMTYYLLLGLGSTGDQFGNIVPMGGAVGVRDLYRYLLATVKDQTAQFQGADNHMLKGNI